jgi:hypothetical protein
LTVARLGELTGVDFGVLLEADVLAGEEVAGVGTLLSSVEDVRLQ